MHLAQITLAQLNGSMVSDEEIMTSMVTAVKKEHSMSMQLGKSYLGNRKLFDAFQHKIAELIYDGVNK